MARSANYRHRIRIEELSQVNVAGEPTNDWLTVATVRGSVEDMSGREQTEAGVVTGRLRTVVYMCYRTDVGIKNRLVKFHTDSGGDTVTDRVLNVESVNDLDGRRRELEVMCVEVP